MALTPAEKQAAYRARQKESKTAITIFLDKKTKDNLVFLATIEEKTQPEIIEKLINSAAKKAEKKQKSLTGN